MKLKFLSVILISAPILTFANTITTKIYGTTAKGPGKYIGTITAKDSPKGLILTPDLKKLTPGFHGFHIHEKPNCDDFGNAAGPHLDPKHSDSHQGPYSNKGHLGDLPRLFVNSYGTATKPLLAPNLTTKMILNHSYMIHEKSDNYTDNPANGGGGARIACGIIITK